MLFSIIAVLGDPYDIRMWNMHGLPRDLMSTENAIMMTSASRWPLIIDPQEQVHYTNTIVVSMVKYFIIMSH